jgi:uncharacterized protein (TIGR02217 family)
MVSSFPVFPGLAFPLRRSPSWMTAKEESIGGMRARHSYWNYPRWNYEISIAALRTSASFLPEMQNLMGFYNSVGGDNGLFLYQDADDNAVTDQPFGAGDGASVSFQLVRTWGSFVEPVFAPTITNVKVSGSPTSAYTLNALGVVQFDLPPAAAAPLTWTGTFKWYCRFEDAMLQTYKLVNGIYALDSLKFSTEKF